MMSWKSSSANLAMSHRSIKLLIAIQNDPRELLMSFTQFQNLQQGMLHYTWSGLLVIFLVRSPLQTMEAVGERDARRAILEQRVGQWEEIFEYGY
ncbi:hypothetical protein SLE2022_306770 [Rubroshorea leprosula]